MEKLRLILMTIAVVLSAAYGLSAQEKYAIIITGDSPGDGYIGQYAVPNSDYDEFWNDTYLMWEMLVTKYGFNDQNVYVLYATGLDENQINPNIATRYTVANSGTLLPKITDYEATIEKVNNVLIGLANGSNNLPYVMEDDFLFVFTFGHGLMI